MPTHDNYTRPARAPRSPYTPDTNYTIVQNELFDHEQPLPLSRRATIVYIALKKFAWQDGQCYPSQQTLAASCRYSVRTVIRAIRELVEAGLIEKRRKGFNMVNVYTLATVSVFKRAIERLRGISDKVSPDRCQKEQTTQTQTQRPPLSQRFLGGKYGARIECGGCGHSGGGHCWVCS